MTQPSHVHVFYPAGSDGESLPPPLQLVDHSWLTRNSSVVTIDAQTQTLSALLQRRLVVPNGTATDGELRMSQEPYHLPAMLQEVLEQVSKTPQGTVIDATIGGGGHAEAILNADSTRRVIGIDRDIDAVNQSRQRLSSFGDRVQIVHARYNEISRIVSEQRSEDQAQIAAVVFDLGVSSHQLDVIERGFSYRFDGPLDMRMDQSDSLRAEDLINHGDSAMLESIFRENGETRFAGRIARSIVSHRPIMTTSELADVVASAVPIPARRRGHPARRVFQALRVAINSELEILEPAIRQAINTVMPHGRVIVLSYQSGEDRMVKEEFRKASTGGCTCPPALPCVCGSRPTVRLITRGSRGASKEEIESNPRAKSARLRVVEKIDPNAPDTRSL